MENEDVVVIKKELMEWRKFKKMVSESSVLEMPAYLFTIIGVFGVGFFLLEGISFDLNQPEGKFLLNIFLLAVFFIIISYLRNLYLLKKIYRFYLKNPQIAKYELFGLNHEYCFYLKSDHSVSREQIEDAIADYMMRKSRQFSNSKKEITELNGMLSDNFDLTIQGTIRPKGIKKGMIVGYDEVEEIYSFKIINAKGKQIYLYNLHRIEELNLKNIILL